MTREQSESVTSQRPRGTFFLILFIPAAMTAFFAMPIAHTLDNMGMAGYIGGVVWLLAVTAVYGVSLWGVSEVVDRV